MNFFYQLEIKFSNHKNEILITESGISRSTIYHEQTEKQQLQINILYSKIVHD